ncbi:hypothetical protein SKAU_G00196700 [Synaphobranchus kaupii]|uniref:HIT domain-containing protein n=1 Tax=Synaphobranchus kaupii TaxID=118154 RepID=A0A9Q1IXF2_SYNKA|nr:hypothetical protein SKAU_G00196700 [Synaphobranchus kaupii]
MGLGSQMLSSRQQVVPRQVECASHQGLAEGRVSQGAPRVLHQPDDELCCFRDLEPGAEHHYLVVPNRHIDSCISLRKEHVPLVEKMVEMGKAVLLKHHVADLADIRMGFHVPPFYSVPHLHLHVLAPASQMNLRSLYNYGPRAFWFITVDQLLQKLNSKMDQPWY